MNVAITREWLDHVERDLDAAWSCSRGPRARPDRAAYLVQQAAEKLMKAALVAARIDPPHTHDIESLFLLLPDDFPDLERFAALGPFTPYAHSFRYPTAYEPPPIPSVADIDEWIDQIAAKTDFERWLEQAAGADSGGSAP
jgi:HEPN domain-containing protein